MHSTTSHPRSRTRSSAIPRLALVSLWALATLVSPGVIRAEDDSDPDPITELRAEIEALKAEHERRIAELEARIAELEADRRTAPTGEPDDLAALRAAAREAAAEARTASGTAAPAPRAGEREASAPDYGRERNLNRLNPEISMTGNVLGVTSRSEREEFRLQELELDVQAALDPFSSTRLTLAVSEEGVEVEEGYVVYPSLRRGLGVTAGRFRQRFGALNRQHLHALPQTEYPLALQTYFGEEGLGQTGLSFDWALPHPWADANHLVFEVTDGSNDAFGGEDFQRLATLGRLTSYWDLTPATYLELG
ncbi:MAG: hypothetical protein PVG07_16740, partial [Acidobacteriota bacterium]